LGRDRTEQAVDAAAAVFGLISAGLDLTRNWFSEL
jgi:hypothetical protein